MKSERRQNRFAKPRIVISRCLTFEKCRWNGEVISDPFVEKFKAHVDCVTPCPEFEIGLGVPRPPIRIVLVDGSERLVQPETGHDLTETMQAYASSYLNDLGEVDGFILKDRSPSCGTVAVKCYHSSKRGAGNSPTHGMFAREVLKRYQDVPVETEGRLHNFSIRDCFLARIYALADFRRVRDSGSMAELVSYQACNKELLRLYHQTAQKQLGRIVANPSKLPFAEVVAAYQPVLSHAFAKPPRFTSAINVLMHMLGYFSEELTSRDKAHFLDMLEQYRADKLPLSAPVSVIRSWALHYEKDYLLQQTFLNPYPIELMEITDSGKGRKL